MCVSIYVHTLFLASSSNTVLFKDLFISFLAFDNYNYEISK